MKNNNDDFEVIPESNASEEIDLRSSGDSFAEPKYGDYDYIDSTINKTNATQPTQANQTNQGTGTKQSSNLGSSGSSGRGKGRKSPSGRNIKNKKDLKSDKLTPGQLKDKIQNAAGKTAKNTGRAMQGAGKAAKIAGKGTQLAGKGVQAGSNALGTAMSAIPVVGGALGAGTKAVGGAVGKGMDAAGKGVEKAGNKVDEAGKKLKEKGKNLQDKSGLDKKKPLGNSEDNEVAAESNNPITFVKKRVKKVVNKLKRILVAKILVPILLVIVVLAILINAIYEIFVAIDNTINVVANVQEKMDNFVNGLGFQNSEDAFFDDMEAQQKAYDNQLNLPLLMSALFYDDIQNNMDPTEVDAAVITDSESLVSFGAVVDYVDSKIEESNVTVGKNGFKYSSNKIYRMRKLAKNMVEKNGTKTASIPEYWDRVKERLGKAFLNMIDITNILEILTAPANFLESVAEMIRGKEVFETTDFGRFIEDNFFTDVWKFLKTIFDSVFDIESVGAGTVTYSSYKFDENKFYKYLKEEYIPKMPEFQKYINNSDESSKEKQIDRIIEGIKDIYEDYKYYFELPDEDAEDYINGCVGSIDQGLVTKLGLPVQNARVSSISGKDAYGIVNGRKNNGVILTKTNSGINTGDSVVSIADGKVVGIGKATGEKQGDVTNSTMATYSTYDLSELELQNLASQCHAEQGGSGIDGVKAEASLMANLYEYQGSAAGSLYNYVLNGNNGRSWFANSKRHMNPVCKNPQSNKGDCCYTTSSGKEKCITYYYTEAELEAVRDVFVNGNRTLPNYVDEHDCFSDISKIVVNGQTYTDSNSIKNKANYIQGQTVIYNVYGSVYTFYTFPADGADPFGYKANTYKNLSNGASTAVTENTNQVTIAHEKVGSYTIYSVYKYLGDIQADLEVGKTVLKGDQIGTVGTVNGYSEPSLYFEIRNENKQSINPTNLFVPCYDKSNLVGNSNKEKIWFYLLANGFTKEGAAGVLGNVAHEASPAFEPVSLEGTSKKKSGYTSEQFTQEVDNGTISRDEFMCSTRFGLQNKDGSYVGNEDSSKICAKLGLSGGEYGYGLNGFTYPTVKEYLLKHTLDVGVSIGDLKGQVDSFLDYLEHNNSSLLAYLKSAKSPGDAAEKMMVEYERPRSLTSGAEARRNAITKRRNEAENLYKELKDLAIPNSNQSQAGAMASSAGFIWPCTSRNVTSKFGNRTAPTPGATSDHRGIDIGLTEGTELYAIADGYISQVNYTNARGHYIRIKHDNGYQSLYQHLSVVKVSTGQRVTQGQVVALSGNSGITSGPHLHFEIFNVGVEPDGWSKNSMDPLLVLPAVNQ